MLFFKRNLKALPSLNFFENVQEVCISVLDRELYIFFSIQHCYTNWQGIC